MKISRFITKHSLAFLVGMLLLCVLCAFLMPQVTINTDMTKYLADDSPMKIGMDLMNEELDVSDSETIRVMFTGLSEDEKSEILETLSSIENVDSVDYEAGSEDYNSGDYTLYVINTDYEVGSDEETSIILMNRYRQELAVHDGDKKASMRFALANAFSSMRPMRSRRFSRRATASSCSTAMRTRRKLKRWRKPSRHTTR